MRNIVILNKVPYIQKVETLLLDADIFKKLNVNAIDIYPKRELKNSYTLQYLIYQLGYNIKRK